MYHTISASGDAEGWNIAFYVFTGCRSLLFFVVIILLATGAQLGGGLWGWFSAAPRVQGCLSQFVCPGGCRPLLCLVVVILLATGEQLGDGWPGRRPRLVGGKQSQAWPVACEAGC